MHAGMTQMMLAEHSGVPQSTISRLERGLVPRSAMVKLVLLSASLGRHLPFAFCPHEHGCVWARLDADGRTVKEPQEADARSWRLDDLG